MEDQTMKKLIICLFAALALFCACEKTTPQVKEDVHAVTSLTAVTAPATRTSTNSGLQVLWSAGDQIAVYGNNGTDPETATPFTLSGEGGSATGTFTGNAVSCGSTAFAVYPYYENYQGLAAGHITTFIPKTQTYVEGSIPEKAFVMAASFNPENGVMTFTPISAVLEIKLYGTASVKKIQIDEYASESSVGGKHLSQAQYLYFDGGTPKIYDSVTSGSSTVILDCPSAVSLGADAANATSFFIVVGANGSFHHLKVTVTDSEGNTHVKNTKNVSGDPISLTSGTVYSLPPMAVNLPETLAAWNMSTNTYSSFVVGTKSKLVNVAESGLANASSGSGYIKFKNNDASNFRTSIPSAAPYAFCCIPVTQGDEIIIAATSCSLNAGDKVNFVGRLQYYENSTASDYEFGYSTDGTTWTKISDCSFTSKTSINIDETVTISAAASQLLFRFLATNNTGVNGSGPNASGQTRIGNHTDKSVLAIYKQ